MRMVVAPRKRAVESAFSRPMSLLEMKTPSSWTAASIFLAACAGAVSAGSATTDASAASSRILVSDFIKTGFPLGKIVSVPTCNA